MHLLFSCFIVCLLFLLMIAALTSQSLARSCILGKARQATPVLTLISILVAAISKENFASNVIFYCL